MRKRQQQKEQREREREKQREAEEKDKDAVLNRADALGHQDNAAQPEKTTTAATKRQRRERKRQQQQHFSVQEALKAINFDTTGESESEEEGGHAGLIQTDGQTTIDVERRNESAPTEPSESEQGDIVVPLEERLEGTPTTLTSSLSDVDDVIHHPHQQRL